MMVPKKWFQKIMQSAQGSDASSAALIHLALDQYSSIDGSSTDISLSLSADLTRRREARHDFPELAGE